MYKPLGGGGVEGNGGFWTPETPTSVTPTLTVNCNECVYIHVCGLPEISEQSGGPATVTVYSVVQYQEDCGIVTCEFPYKAYGVDVVLTAEEQPLVINQPGAYRFMPSWNLGDYPDAQLVTYSCKGCC